jgi:C-terminal processing protease CtpA/Prc
MNKRTVLKIGGVSLLGVALLAVSAFSAHPQSQDETVARLQAKIAKLQAELESRLDSAEDRVAPLAKVQAELASEMAEAQERKVLSEIDALPEIEQDVNIVVSDEGSGWLGVETREVTSEKAKELKLPAERGVLLGKILPDSPASKAGLKENDVVTQLNGQPVEGATQFRRMIHEIPPGRAIQLTIWRDGRSQTQSVTLGKSEEIRHRLFNMEAPRAGNFAFAMPAVPEVPELPGIGWGEMGLLGGQPRLGIDAEDLNGDFGKFFGAPDGEGVLVREVNSGSVAERAGLKPGDVITFFNGERVRSVGDLREKLAAKHDEKEKTAKLGVLRNKSELSLSVELPEAQAHRKRIMTHRTNI